jgi:hypothetical protein
LLKPLKMLRFSFACLAALLVALTAAPARADPEQPIESVPARPPVDPWAHRPVSILSRLEVGGGSFGPVGVQGLLLEVTPIRWVSVVGGGGIGFDGPQVTGMVRGRLFLTRNVAVSLGFGPSAGRYVDTDEPLMDFSWVGCLFSGYGGIDGGGSNSSSASCPRYYRKEYSTAWWANTELALEGRTGGGFEWRLFAGVGSLLNPNDGSCTSTTPCPVTSGVAGYAGTELGYAFGR